MAWFITLGCVQWSITFPAFLIQNQIFIEKFEENEADFQRIETGTSRGVAQQCLLFSMLLPVLVNHIQADMNLLRFFLWQNCLGIMDFSLEKRLRIQNFPCVTSLHVHMAWSKINQNMQEHAEKKALLSNPT